MKLSIKILQDNNYIEYKNERNRMKYYLISFRKVIDDIVVDIDVLKSIRGGILFKVKYYFRDIKMYSIDTKKASLNDIEKIAVIIKETLVNIIDNTINN